MTQNLVRISENASTSDHATIIISTRNAKNKIKAFIVLHGEAKTREEKKKKNSVGIKRASYKACLTRIMKREKGGQLRHGRILKRFHAAGIAGQRLVGFAEKLIILATVHGLALAGLNLDLHGLTLDFWPPCQRFSATLQTHPPAMNSFREACWPLVTRLFQESDNTAGINTRRPLTFAVTSIFGWGFVQHPDYTDDSSRCSKNMH